MGSNNDDCVTVFRNNEGGDDIQSVAQTPKSMGDNTLFEKSHYSIVNDFLYLIQSLWKALYFLDQSNALHFLHQPNLLLMMMLVLIVP